MYAMYGPVFVRPSVPSKRVQASQAFARDQMEHFKIGFKQPPQTEAGKDH